MKNTNSMNKERLDRLIATHYVQTASYNVSNMNAYIIAEASAMGLEVKKNNGNLYITKGVSPNGLYPCMVSHTDTVHDMYSNFEIYQSEDKLFSINASTMRRVGIGGDDKVGVWTCLEVLRELPYAKVAFFRDEEVGCIGSGLADMNFFKDVTCILQCDRRGYKDFIKSICGAKLYSKAFGKAIKPILDSYGRVPTSGGLTDVYTLKTKDVGVCVANMSCGYYDPHTDNEYIIISECDLTLRMCLEVLRETSNKRWEHKYESSYGNYDYGYYSGGKGAYRQGLPSPQKTTLNVEFVELTEEDTECPHCGGSANNISYDSANQELFCFDCYNTISAKDLENVGN